MKKTMFAVVCMAMMAMGCMAKDNSQKGQKHHSNAPRQEMVDPVINMKIVEEMGLPEKKVKDIEELKAKRFDEIKNMRAEMKKEHAHGKQHMDKKGQHFAEHKAKMNAINEKYRKDMQDIMGTKTYVKYVEKVNDRLAMHQMKGKGNHKGHGMKGHHGKKMHKHGMKMHQQHNGKMHRHQEMPKQPQPMPDEAA